MKQVVSERCPLCGGRKQPGKTTYSVDLGSGVILVRNVPATVCVQCGEAWIDHLTAQKLEQITQEAREKGLQVEVVAF
jgi:YgiT-type zinc finger domain-containing protein